MTGVVYVRNFDTAVDASGTIELAEGQWITMNSTAAAVWSLLREPQSEATLMQHLNQQYSGSTDQMENSIYRLLQRWIEIDLIRQVDERAG